MTIPTSSGVGGHCELLVVSHSTHSSAYLSESANPDLGAHAKDCQGYTAACQVLLQLPARVLVGGPFLIVTSRADCGQRRESGLDALGYAQYQTTQGQSSCMRLVFGIGVLRGGCV